MKRYPVYKDSNVQWLGPVPGHWEIKPNRSLFYIRKVPVGRNSADFTLLSLTLQGIIPRDLDNPKGKFPADFGTYQGVAPSDLVFCLFDMDETPRTVGIVKDLGMITGAYTSVRCYDSTLAEYLHYYYLALDTSKRLRPVYTGLRKVIQKDRFLSIRSPVPPRPEREAIVHFLDKETSRIDNLIAKQEKMIEFLKEHRTALISRAAIRGLNSKVALKDSGVSWLGKVPIHWEIKPLKSLAACNQKTLSEDTPPDLPIHYIDINNVSFERGLEGLEELLFGKAPSRARRIVREGDVIISTVRTYLKAIVQIRNPEQNTIASTGFAVITPNERAFSDFLSHFCKSHEFVSEIEARSVGVSYPAINASEIMRLAICVPPLPEAAEIARYIEAETGKIQSLISKQELMIQLLRERRSALITQVVTGQIDVRGS